ncbi:MAG: CDP-alcohol phosphatidyltransferase family protein [Promethearchaeota archaeon]
MPSKFRIRYIFRPLVEIIAKGLIKIGITPNIATFLMFFFAIISAISLVIFSNLLLFAFFIFITGIMDGCDGAIARLTNKSSSFGGFFDSVMDRFSEFIIFLGLLIYCWDELLWKYIDMKIIIILSFLSSIMISYIRTRAQVSLKGDSNIGDLDIGLMARSERLFYIFLIMVIAFFYGLMNELLFTFMWLVIGTAIYRFAKINKMIKKQVDQIKD